MDFKRQTPEFGDSGLERVVFDQLLTYALMHGVIDTEYDLPGNREQYPRTDLHGKAAHSFELKKPLETKHGFDASSVIVFYVEEYVDEEGFEHAAKQLYITLTYEIGYQKSIWLALQEDGSMSSQVHLEAPSMVSRDKSDPLNEAKEAVLDAIQSGDTDALQELIAGDERLRDYIERLSAILSPFNVAPVDRYDLEELREVVRQLDDSL